MSRTRRKTKTSPGRGILAVSLAAVMLLAIIGLGRLAAPGSVSEPLPDPVRGTLAENPYSAGDFTYEGDYLTCTAGSARLGVDVSSHQREVDWARVAGAGMEFAMVRIGYRGYTYGSISTDEYAAANLTGAKAAGLQVGAYFYSQAITPEEAAEEAEFCIEFLKDHALDLPVVFDWEYVNSTARTANMDMETLTECARVFCAAIEDAGFDAMIYFNPDIARNLLDLELLTEYPFWLALYSDMTYPHRVDMWQYTQKGTVPGIAGDADINLWFTD